MHLCAFVADVDREAETQLWWAQATAKLNSLRHYGLPLPSTCPESLPTNLPRTPASPPTPGPGRRRGVRGGPVGAGLAGLRGRPCAGADEGVVSTSPKGGSQDRGDSDGNEGSTCVPHKLHARIAACGHSPLRYGTLGRTLRGSCGTAKQMAPCIADFYSYPPAPPTPPAPPSRPVRTRCWPGGWPSHAQTRSARWMCTSACAACWPR